MNKRNIAIIALLIIVVLCIAVPITIKSQAQGAQSGITNTENTTQTTPNNEAETATEDSSTVHECVFSDWSTTIAATCTENGIEMRKCECGTIEENIIKALGHDIITTTTSELTCTQNGIKVTTCVRCDYESEEVTEAIGHRWSDYTISKNATCTKDGSKERSCDICKEVETIAITKLNHSYKNGKCTRCKTEDPNHFPKVYQDDGVTITIHKVTGYGAGNTTCYVAEIQLTDYKRFFTACGKNTYGGQSSTSAAAKLQNAVFAVNGCYSAPYLGYQVVRKGVIYNGGDRNCGTPGVYSSMTGIFGSPAMLGINGMTAKDAVAQGLLTDTFCFGPAGLINGVNQSKQNNDRAQRTFIGSNGTPGHMVIGVCNGRYSDGVSAGLTYYEINELLLDYGCTFGIPLDGGGSSTMVFNGQILNQLANNQERNWIVDFVCIGKK